MLTAQPSSRCFRKALRSGRGRIRKRKSFPYSTVDILVLLEGESPWVSLREPLAEYVRLLWDAGLRLNHTVRTVSERLEFRKQNIDLDVNLLDLRYLLGDNGLSPVSKISGRLF